MASKSVNSACYGHQTTKFYVFFWYCRTANLTGLRQVAAPFDDDDDDDE